MPRSKAKSSSTAVEYSPSSLPPSHFLVQLGPPQGSNNFLCTDTSGEERLVELTSKLRKGGTMAMLVTRGDYAVVVLFPPDPEVIVPPAKGKGKAKENEEVSGNAAAGTALHLRDGAHNGQSGNGGSSQETPAKGKSRKLVGEIVKVFSSKEVKDFKRAGEWPSDFPDARRDAIPEPTAAAEDDIDQSGEDEDGLDSASERE